MEHRRIQITGGSSYMITLPKDWADSVNLKKNDAVSLIRQADGSLLIYPGKGDHVEKRSKKTIEVENGTDENFLYRELVGAYIAGHDTIEIESRTNIPGNLAAIASMFTQTSIGLEIIEENDESIVIKDLMDPEEIKPTKSIDRMKVLTRNMLTDILNAAEKGNVTALTSMHHRDREVDRIHWLISRQVNIHQKDILWSSKTDINLCEITRCNQVSRCIERIGDHAVLLTKNLKKILDEGGMVMESCLIPTGREIVSLFVDSVETWNRNDLVAANTCIEKANELIEGSIKIYKRNNNDRDSATEVILSSMRRIAEYCIDISEIAINSAMDD